MVYSLKCADLGKGDCTWQGTGSTVEELMMKAGQHAKEAHNITSFPPEMLAQVKAAIKQV
jgi:predicted small metal-binding protein